MSGSFPYFCLLILAIFTILLSRESIDAKTFGFLKVVQTLALAGAVVMFAHQFGASLTTGILTAILVVVSYLFFAGWSFRADVLLLGDDEESVMPLTLREAGSDGTNEEREE